MTSRYVKQLSSMMDVYLKNARVFLAKPHLVCSQDADVS